ncbi:MAG: hypothetical protein R2797_05645 [Gelidibacter sp.]
MQFKTYLQSKLPFYLALSSLFVLASCGSYQYVGHDSDGIYNSTDEPTPTEETKVTNDDNAYYKGYFAEKSDKYARIAEEENVIFTDIDDYEGTYNEATGEVEYEEGYAGWGQDSDNVTINVYSNYGWNNWGWYGWYSPWRYRYGWYSPWAFGYGYGWNGYYGYYDPFYYGYGYYGGFYSPYYYGYNGYYGHNYYRRNVAYNSGRRGSYINYSGRNINPYRNNDVRSTTRRNTSIRNSSSTLYNPANSVRSNTRINNNVRSNSTRSNTRINTNSRSSNTRSNTRVNVPSRSSSRSSTVRSSGPSRSSSSSSSGRSSGGSSRRGG